MFRQGLVVIACVALVLGAPVDVDSSTQLHPNAVVGKCLDVQGNLRKAGTPVEIYDCNGSSAQAWSFSKGSTNVRLGKTGFCLDAGENVQNGSGLTITECKENSPSQQWNYTVDMRLVFGQGWCVDFANGSLENGNKVQVWECSENNSNQLWTVATQGKPTKV